MAKLVNLILVSFCSLALAEAKQDKVINLNFSQAADPNQTTVLEKETEIHKDERVNGDGDGNGDSVHGT